MAPRKGTTVEPPKPLVEEIPFSPPTITAEEIKATGKEAKEAEQRELDNAWKDIPYVDQKDLRAGYYAGMEMDRLVKPWQVGGHVHDFYKSSRLSRPTNLTKHYEFGELLKRHDRLVFDLEQWRLREFLKDDMKIQLRKMYEVQKERVKFQNTKEQLHYESTLRLPLSPHTERSGFDSDEEESLEPEQETQIEGEIPGGLPPSPEDSGDEGSSSGAGASSETAPEASTPRKKEKTRGLPPGIRYSVFHYDIPRRMKRHTPCLPPEKPPEYSSPVTVHTPAWLAGKARYTNEMVQEVIALDAWEEKLAGGGGGVAKPPLTKGSVKK